MIQDVGRWFCLSLFCSFYIVSRPSYFTIDCLLYLLPFIVCRLFSGPGAWIGAQHIKSYKIKSTR